MLRFFNKLFRDLKKTSPSHVGRGAPRRAMLQVEGLEDRLVMSTVTHPLLMNAISAGPGVAHTQSSLAVTQTVGPKAVQPAAAEFLNFSQPGLITIKSDGAGNTDVYAPGQPMIQWRTASVSSVSIQLHSTYSNTNPSGTMSSLDIDDSNGMPFAPATTIDVNDTGSSIMNLQGSRTVSGNETYVAGGMPWTPGKIFLDNLTFTVHSGIISVSDTIPITGNFDVQTSGTQVQLDSYGPVTQYVSGMGVGGGDFLSYNNKPLITLETYAPNAGVFLDAPDAAAGEKDFRVFMHGAGDRTIIDQTPKNVVTSANSNLGPVADNARVDLWGNFGPVNIVGNSSTVVTVGWPENSTGTITRGILASVNVNAVAALIVNNSGNVSTNENVTVTDHTISGSGLFGNAGVTLFYGGVAAVTVDAGQLADNYTVAPSSASAVFTSSILIDSFSNTTFHVNVTVNAASHLDLHLVNEHPQDGAVLEVISNGFVDLPGTLPNGTIDVFFAGQATSKISYTGFAKVF